MSEKSPYLNPHLPVEARVKDLLQRMTLEEKITQLGSIPALDLLENGIFSQEKATKLLSKGIGQITRISGTREIIIRLEEAAEIANEIQKFLSKETRLRIPAIIHEECLSGLMGYGATTFPQAIGMSSTWNPDMMQSVTAAIRRQVRAAGAHQGLSPVLDVARDQRWGRVEETLGEESYLVASMGTAYVKGLQGEDFRSGVIATVKHFAAHGFPEGGRNCASVHVGPREFREVFLFPFEVAVKVAGVRSLMNAYHDVDGIPCASSRELLTGILREEWGFEGFVVSDYWAIKQLETFHNVAANGKEAAVQAFEAGIDIELPKVDCYGGPLLEAVEEGKVSGSVVDKAVSRVLRAKFLLGLFENPYVDAALTAKLFDTPEDRKLALEAARESIVLLKNDGLLPLNKDIKSITVVGPNADSTVNLLGDYSYTAHLNREKNAVPVKSVLDSIKSKVSPKTAIHYAKGCGIHETSMEGFKEALEASGKSDVIIAIMGEKSGIFQMPAVTGEGRDQASLRLPGVQEDLIKALHELGKPIIVVLVNGRPLSMKWIAENCSAIVEAWLPGEEGGSAIADVLFSDYNPGGKLPISFPQDVGQIPLNYNRRPSSFRDYVFVTSKPLYPFGHGLSYTRFDYGSLTIAPEKVDPSGKVTIGFEVENVGTLKGDEVVQLYVRDMVASVSRPVKELKGFKRITLEPGEEKNVGFKLSMDQLAFYDRDMRLIVEPGTFEVMVGSSSEDIRLNGSFEIVGTLKATPPQRTFFSEVTVQ